MQKKNILIWLPSPMGDAVLATSALRGIRAEMHDHNIYFYSNRAVRDVLTPCKFNDFWITEEKGSILRIASKLRKYNFSEALLLKNSFGCALAVYLAGIKKRVGYVRDGRGCLINEKIYPEKLSRRKFKPGSMVKYYNAIAEKLGCKIIDEQLELSVDAIDRKNMKEKLPAVFDEDKPLFILVCGGAFGPSKCWPTENFAKIADMLIGKYGGNVVLSVSPSPVEKKIANEISLLSKNQLINLGKITISLGELKALYEQANLVIANDTGPRHISIALKKKIVTLFGPNDPVWTDTGFKDEIQIITDVECAPCQKPVCPKKKHICMRAIEVEKVFEAATELLQGDK